MRLPTREDLKNMKPDKLRECLETSRKEVDNYYKLFRIAANYEARKTAQRGWKMSYKEGSKYLMELKRRHCHVPSLKLEVPQEMPKTQKSLFEEVTQ